MLLCHRRLLLLLLTGTVSRARWKTGREESCREGLFQQYDCCRDRRLLAGRGSLLRLLRLLRLLMSLLGLLHQSIELR